MRRTSAGTMLGIAAWAVLTSTTVAHHPDPAFAGALFAQDQHVEYGWRSGQVPPLWMRAAIDDAAIDNNISRRSKAATFGYDNSAPSSIAYGTPDPCGDEAAACMRRYAPDSFAMWMRPHGYQMDWGTFRWCESLRDVPERMLRRRSGGTPRVRPRPGPRPPRGRLSDEADYRDSIMNSIARPKPNAFYNAHRYAKCDVATLQRKYDVRDWSYDDRGVPDAGHHHHDLRERPERRLPGPGRLRCRASDSGTSTPTAGWATTRCRAGT